MQAVAAFIAGMWLAIRQAAPAMAGATIAFLIDLVKEDRKLTQQYKDILDEERKAAERPVADAAKRLRESGWTVPDDAP